MTKHMSEVVINTLKKFINISSLLALNSYLPSVYPQFIDIGVPKGVSGECPDTKVLDKMTLKGGVDAGAYKDHGKVKDMDVCRRICCEMTECHLAFMLGTNCFSVKCASVDSCRAQKAKPSAYYPKVS